MTEVVFVVIVAVAAFSVIAFAKEEEDRKAREAELIAMAGRCRDDSLSYLTRRCSADAWDEKCNSIRPGCITVGPVETWQYQFECHAGTGVTYSRKPESCSGDTAGLPSYETKLVRLAANGPLFEAICKKQAKPPACPDLLKILSGPSATTPVSLSLPVALSKLMDYFVEQLEKFFKKSCQTPLRKDKKLLVTCSPKSNSAGIACEGNEKTQLTVEEVANAYGTPGQPTKPNKSHIALWEIFCKSGSRFDVAQTLEKLKENAVEAANSIDLGNVKGLQ